MQGPRMTFTAVVLDVPDAGVLARFYTRLLGWEINADESGWVTIVPPGGGTGLSFATEPLYVPPTWPSKPGEQQMMLHLDIEVDSLREAVAHAEACGATVAGFQPQDDVRVLLDPAGHPFCLWVRAPGADV